jgi:hypothetical protein
VVIAVLVVALIVRRLVLLRRERALAMVAQREQELE